MIRVHVAAERSISSAMEDRNVGEKTRDNIMEEYVVYRRLYGDNSLWIREKGMFLSEVDHEKYPDVKQKWRFELVEEVEFFLNVAYLFKFE